MSALGDYADVQGTLLRGYRANCARHFILRVVDPAAARSFLGALVSGPSGLPQITTAEDWGPGGKPEFVLNVAITFAGLRHLGVETRFLESFPEPFRRGATDEITKLRVGDTGPSDPSQWTDRLGEGEAVDLILSLWVWRYKVERETVSGILRQAFAGALEELSARDAKALPGNKVHFGYTDNISQPLVEGAPGRKHRTVDPERVRHLPITHVLLHEKRILPEALSTNSGFAAFRVLEQDVVGFEEFLDRCSAEAGIGKELLAAKVCGRWRTGVPLSRSPGTPHPTPPLTEEELNDFDYLPDDPLGHTCPIGSHIRRTNPRSQAVQGGPGMVDAARIVRRAMPYGRAFDPDHPDREPRGLVGYFINSDLLMFEFVMKEWVNGSQFVMSVPSEGSNARYNISGKDVLVGASARESSSFTLPVRPSAGGAPANRTLTGFDRFVTTRGGAYVYFPSITAIRHLANLPA